jgi:hypothetical protein
MEKGTLINVEHNGETIRVWVLRAFNTINSPKYNRFLDSLLYIMPPEQIESIIVRYPRPVILLDDILRCFKYYGPDPCARSSYCICGQKISKIHGIRNVMTRKKYRIGSSCCHHWSLQSHHAYTPTKTYKLMRVCFDAIGQDYLVIKHRREREREREMEKLHPTFHFGQYRGKTISSIIKRDRSYCYWCYQTEKGLPSFQMELKRQLLA